VRDLITNDVMPFQKQVNFCNDRRLVEKFETKDPSKPGIYVMNAQEAAFVKKAAGATSKWIKSNTPADADAWVDKFAQEADALVQANPAGSSQLEKTDCEKIKPYFTKYTKK
jgi:hypothetical protein